MRTGLGFNDDRRLGNRPAERIDPPFIKELATPRQVAGDCVLRVGIFHDHLELETGGLAEQVDRALRVLDPGQLDQDAIICLTLQGRFADAKLIDAITQGFKRLAHGIFLNGFDFTVAQAVILLDDRHRQP